MKKPGAMFTVELKVNSTSQIEKFCHSLKRFLLAVSWGGHESLVFPACATIKNEEYDSKKSEHNLVRFYAGLEDPDLLTKDIENALIQI